MVLGFFTMGLITRQTRSNLLETMSMDYIRTGRAKGMSERRLVTHHALGNALIPVITVAGMGFCNLLGGMVFVEKIFRLAGHRSVCLSVGHNARFSRHLRRVSSHCPDLCHCQS